MNPPFTPGRWDVAGLQVVAEEDGLPICEVSRRVYTAPGNARLLASAPELFAALRMVWEAGELGHRPELERAVFDALAKATGAP